MRRKAHRGRILLLLLSLSLVSSLAVDLHFRGAIWRALWSITGEEEPLPQARGALDFLGDILRQPPRGANYAAKQHAGVNPYGINTFLQLEAEPQNIERQLNLIAAAGFHWLRQEFPWEDIEIHGRGDFSDRRNLDSVGEISAWAKYDRIVDMAEERGLRLQVRLSNPPAWSRANPDKGAFAPPDRFEDFVNYAVAVAERYRGRIHHYQVWNEPNIHPEWGDNAIINPEEYSYLLCQTYAALKAVDPEIVVISGALAPTNWLTDRDLSELVFLQRMYDYGAAPCFDVLGLQGYGLFSGPTDARRNPNQVNYARNRFIRDLMVANGEAAKAIWFSEAAWNPVRAAAEIPAHLQDANRYGAVTQEQAARYMPIAYQRAAEDWPWLGVINYWFFRRPDESEVNQSYYYFRMVEPDWQPLPIYAAMRAHISEYRPPLTAGRHQAEHWAIHGKRVPITLEGADFGIAQRLEGSLDFTIRGTSIALQPAPSPEQDSIIHLSRQSQLTAIILCHQCPTSDESGAHIIEVSPDYALDAILVYDRAIALQYPIWALVGTLLFLSVAVVHLARREGR